MRCERCQSPIRGATWFCPNCGAPVRDLNVADSVAGTRARNWGPILAGLVVLLALGIVMLVRRDPGRPNEPLPDPGAGGATAAPFDGPTLPPESLAARATAMAAATSAADGAATPPDPSAEQEAGAPPGVATEPGSMATAGGPPPAPDTPAAPASTGPAIRVRPGAPLWRIPRVDFPPRLDGDLSDWPPSGRSAQPLYLTAVVHGLAAWRDLADLSGEAWAGYDERALYLGVRVRDERVAQYSRGAELYLGDSLELQVDTDLEGDWEAPAYGADDWHIGLSALGPGAPESWIWRPAARAGPAALPLSARPRPDGYDVELALPWALLGLPGPPDRPIGLNLSLSDDDQDGPSQDTMVSSSPIRKWDDARTLGTAVLEP